MHLLSRRALPAALCAGAVAVALTTALPAPVHAAPSWVEVDRMFFVGDPADPSAGAMLDWCEPDVDQELVIPSQVTIGGVLMDVVTIDEFACDDSRVDSTLTSITIPDTVTHISDSAFKNVKATSLHLGAGVTHIGTSAFEGNSLTSLEVPEGVVSIGNVAFAFNQLTSVTLPDSLTELRYGAFAFNQLTHVEIPASLDLLESAVFANNNITSLTSRSRVPVIIVASAFENNDFTTLVIPDGVTEIGFEAFLDNPLTSVHLPSSLTHISSHAFWPSPLTTITFAGDAPNLEPNWAKLNGATVYYPKGATGFTLGDWPGLPLIEYVTVTFDTSGYGAAPPPIDVATGGTVTPPAAPERPGYDFVGWFDAPTGGNPVDFTAVSDHTTAYAQWVDTAESLTAPASAVAGATISLTGDGYQPNEPLEIWLLSTPVQLTTLTADAQGAFTTTVTIPANVTPGAHTLEIRGAQSPTFAQSFTVFAALPATGPDPSAGPIGVAALLLTGAGVGLVLITRRRRVRRA